MRQEYLTEAMDGHGHWYILGGAKTSGDAQLHMRNYRAIFPKLPLRVVEHPSRTLIVCHDPMGEPFSARGGLA